MAAAAAVIAIGLDALDPLAKRLGDSDRHALAGQRCQLAGEPVGLFVLDVQAHLSTFFGKNSPISRPLGKPRRQAENPRTAGGCRRDEADDELSRNLPPVAREAGRILG